MIFVFLLAASRAFCSEVTALCSLFLLYHRFTLYAVDTRGRHSELRRAKGLWQTLLDLEQQDLLMVFLMVASRGAQKLTEV